MLAAVLPLAKAAAWAPVAAAVAAAVRPVAVGQGMHPAAAAVVADVLGFERDRRHGLLVPLQTGFWELAVEPVSVVGRHGLCTVCSDRGATGSHFGG